MAVTGTVWALFSRLCLLALLRDQLHRFPLRLVETYRSVIIHWLVVGISAECKSKQNAHMFLCEKEVKLWMQGITLQQGAIVEASPVYLSWPARGISATSRASTRGTGWAGVISVLWGLLHLQSTTFLCIPVRSNIWLWFVAYYKPSELSGTLQNPLFDVNVFK